MIQLIIDRLRLLIYVAMVVDVFQGCNTGFAIRYRFEGKLLNLRRLQAKPKVQSSMLMTWIRMPIQWQKCIRQLCDNYDLTISYKRTDVVVHQPAQV